MAGSLRFDLFVIHAMVRRRARFGCTGAYNAALRASASANNHAHIDRVILVRYIETAGGHDIDVGVHRQVL